MYAANDHVPRRELWHSINMFKHLVGDSPWIIMGDFNATLTDDEYAGGNVSSTASADFQQCVQEVEVFDLHYSGMYFTWSGSPHGSGVVKKLDRILVYTGFINKFQTAKARFLAPKTSDHSPVVLDFSVSNNTTAKGPFRFQNFPAYRKNFREIVQKGWEYNPGGVKMYQLVKRLKYLKPTFKKEAWKIG